MMRFNWDNSIYRWCTDAGIYTGYDRMLAEMLMEKAGFCREETLCDMGCGAARVDLELAKNLGEITCVDLSEFVIEKVKKEIRDREIRNVRAVCSDGMAMTGSWDTVMAIFHAQGIEGIQYYLTLARKQLVLVVRGSNLTEVGLGKYRELQAFDCRTVPKALEEAGIAYEFSEHEIEHGQPFRTYEEAVAYTRIYREMEDEDIIRGYLDKRLVKTGEKEFPYYIPKKKHLGIFVIRKKPLFEEK